MQIINQEIRIQLLHKVQPVNRDAQFYQFQFKTEWCPFILNHERQHCVYAHNPQDFRRKPVKNKYGQWNYDLQNCTKWNRYHKLTSYDMSGCSQGLKCNKCHGWKELEYHPLFYKSRPCVFGMNCKLRNLDCPYYHSSQDRIQNILNDEQLEEIQQLFLQNSSSNQKIQEQIQLQKQSNRQNTYQQDSSNQKMQKPYFNSLQNIPYSQQQFDQAKQQQNMKIHVQPCEDDQDFLKKLRIPQQIQFSNFQQNNNDQISNSNQLEIPQYSRFSSNDTLSTYSNKYQNDSQGSISQGSINHDGYNLQKPNSNKIIFQSAKKKLSTNSSDFYMNLNQ